MGQRVKVGMVGAGKISGQYLETLAGIDTLELVAVADMVPARAREVAQQVPTARALGLEELLAAEDVELVLNLTVPQAHAEVALAGIAAGKMVYGEKPLAATLAEAAEVVRAAELAGVTIGCAPDTVLGTGMQSARKAVDDGLVGTPISASATFMNPGPERWHPNPDFLYAPGGGPLLDLGPYYVSGLVTLLGPVVRVIGAGSRKRDHRVIGSGPRAGELIPVLVDTHVTGVLEHRSGVLSTLVTSFDAVGTRASRIEVHGDRGSLVVPDPNRFDGDPEIRRAGADDWEVLPVSAGYRDAGRGVGMLDFTTGSPRAGGALAFHVLEVLERVLESAEKGVRVDVTSTVERPEPVPLQDLPRPS
ncbi:Gfo/Idh/MocA family oxidoreductase [Actinomycetes bacterium KLBMP 9759]